MPGWREALNYIPQAIKIGERLTQTPENKPPKPDTQETVVQPENTAEDASKQMRADLQRRLRDLTAQMAPEELQDILNMVDFRGSNNPTVKIPNAPGMTPEIANLAERVTRMEQMHREYQARRGGNETAPTDPDVPVIREKGATPPPEQPAATPESNPTPINADFWRESANRGGWDQTGNAWSRTASESGLTPDFNPNIDQTESATVTAPESDIPVIREKPAERVVEQPAPAANPDFNRDFWTNQGGDSNVYDRSGNAWSQAASRGGVTPSFNPDLGGRETVTTPTPNPSETQGGTWDPRTSQEITNPASHIREWVTRPADDQIIETGSSLRDWVKPPENGIIMESAPAPEPTPERQAAPTPAQINESMRRVFDGTSNSDETPRIRTKRARTNSGNGRTSRRQTSRRQPAARPATPARAPQRRPASTPTPERRAPTTRTSRRETPRPQRTPAEIDARFKELAGRSQKSQAEVDRRFAELTRGQGRRR